MPKQRRAGWLTVLASIVVLSAGRVQGRELPVADARALAASLLAAGPGDTVAIAPGIYQLPRTVLRRSGAATAPITVRAARPGSVEIRTRAAELFKITGSDWVFENLDIAGVCSADADCEHAFHIVGGADRTVIRHDRIRDFNAQIKGNGEGGRFPRDVVIEDNMLFDTHRRAIELPLAEVDVVGGRGWTVRDNLFGDFGKEAPHPPRTPDDFGYALFLKGNSSDGTIEGNIVGCALALPPAPYTRGLSLGGSASDPGRGLCQGGCATEHRDGVIRQNVVIDCPNGFGIYLYQASGSRIMQNALIDTRGILARAPYTSARIAGNVVSGEIAASEGARVVTGDNLLIDLLRSPAGIVVPGDVKPTIPPPPGSGPPELALAAIGGDLCGYLTKLGSEAGASGYRPAGCAAMANKIADYRRYVGRLRERNAPKPAQGERE
jgi:hypothetical protein